MAKLVWPLHLGNRRCTLVLLGGVVPPGKGLDSHAPVAVILPLDLKLSNQSLTLFETRIIQRVIRGSQLHFLWEKI